MWEFSIREHHMHEREALDPGAHFPVETSRGAPFIVQDCPK